VNNARNRPRDSWPKTVMIQINRVGISRFETLASLLPKVAALRLTVLHMLEKNSGYLVKHVMYCAEVIDELDRDRILHIAYSETDHVESISKAVGAALSARQHRESHQLERFFSLEPDVYSLRDQFGVSLRSLHGRGSVVGIDGAHTVAKIVVGQEVVAEIDMPARRFTAVWTADDESLMRDLLRSLATKCELRGRKGSVVLVVFAGTGDEVREIIWRPDASLQA